MSIEKKKVIIESKNEKEERNKDESKKSDLKEIGKFYDNGKGAELFKILFLSNKNNAGRIKKIILEIKGDINKIFLLEFEESKIAFDLLSKKGRNKLSKKEKIFIIRQMKDLGILSSIAIPAFVLPGGSIILGVFYLLNKKRPLLSSHVIPYDTTRKRGFLGYGLTKARIYFRKRKNRKKKKLSIPQH